MTGVSGGDARPDVGRDAVVPLDGGSRLPREVLGNKGFGINLMRARGLPVPPAFCLVTDVCAAFLAGDERVLDRVWPDVLAGVRGLERETSTQLRSGAAAAAPQRAVGGGTVDAGHARHGARPRDRRRRAPGAGVAELGGVRRRHAVPVRRDVPADRARAGTRRPRCPTTRSVSFAAPSRRSSPPGAVRGPPPTVLTTGSTTRAARQSWSRRWCSATSALTPAPGCCSAATPRRAPTNRWANGCPARRARTSSPATFDCLPLEALRTAQPGVFAELMAASDELERLAGDVQDIEFTVEGGTLWLLQTRVAKRSAQAAVRLALAFRAAGLIDDAEVLRRVTPEHVRDPVVPLVAARDPARRCVVGDRPAREPGCHVGHGVHRPRRRARRCRRGPGRDPGPHGDEPR